MSEASQSPSAKERVSSHLYFGSLYFVTVGVLYLWGYWTPFGINILEYLALSDILKVTAYPIATALLLATIGAALGEGLANVNHLPPGGGRDTAVGHFVHRFAHFLLMLYVAGTLALLLYGPVEKWRVIPILLALPIYSFAKQTHFLAKAILNDRSRSIVIYVLAVLPPSAYGYGTLAANKIQAAQAFTYAVSEFPGYPASTDAKTQPRLVGHAGDYIFLFDPHKNAVIVGKLESGKSLVLKQYKTPSSSIAAEADPSPKATTAGKPGSAP